MLNYIWYKLIVSLFIQFLFRNFRRNIYFNNLNTLIQCEYKYKIFKYQTYFLSVIFKTGFRWCAFYLVVRPAINTCRKVALRIPRPKAYFHCPLCLIRRMAYSLRDMDDSCHYRENTFRVKWDMFRSTTKYFRVPCLVTLSRNRRSPSRLSPF